MLERSPYGGLEILSDKIILKGRKIVGGLAEGEALVTRQGIDCHGGVDPRTGVIIERRHELRGEAVKDKILVFPYGKGSSGWARQFYYLCSTYGNSPKAIILKRLMEMVVVGAIATRTPMICCSDPDPTVVIKTGDTVRVDANKGTIEVSRKH